MLNQEILDILPNRCESDLISYFKKFPSRENVKYFISDMNPHFRSVAKVCFPNAILIVDKYHVVRQAVWAMERIRKAEQKKLSNRFRVYFKRSRYLLNKPSALEVKSDMASESDLDFKPRGKLTEEEMDRLAPIFEIAPRLADAYQLKNEFVSAMRATSSQECRVLLHLWLKSLHASNGSP